MKLGVHFNCETLVKAVAIVAIAAVAGIFSLMIINHEAAKTILDMLAAFF